MDAPQTPVIAVPDFTMKELAATPLNDASGDSIQAGGSEKLQASVASVVASTIRTFPSYIHASAVIVVMLLFAFRSPRLRTRCANLVCRECVPVSQHERSSECCWCACASITT